MTIQFTVYDASGTILRTGETLTVAQANAQATGAGTYVTLVGSDPVTQQINPATTAVTSRPSAGISCNKVVTAGVVAMTANGSDQVTFSGVVNPSTATITVPTGVGINPISPLTITDTVLSITTTVAGSYGVLIVNPPNADYKVTLNAS